MKNRFSRIGIVCCLILLLLACIPEGTTPTIQGTTEVAPLSAPDPGPTHTPDPQMLIEQATLYRTDFEDGYPFELSDSSLKWHIETEESGNSIFCNEISEEWSSFLFGLDAWRNYAVSLRVKFLSANENQSAETYIRVDQSVKGYRASIWNNEWAGVSFFPPTADLGGTPVSINQGEWSRVRLAFVGDKLEYFLNDELLLETEDGKRTSGRAGFGAGPNTEVCVDDIHVWGLDEGGNPVESPADLVIGPFDGEFYSISKKIANRPTIPVFYPWPWQNPDGIWCGETAQYGFDCDTEDTPYSLVWISDGIPQDIESTQPRVPPPQTAFMRSDEDTLYLISEEWHYWNLGWRTLSPDSKFYLDEIFGAHVNSEYGDTKVINFEHPDWPGVMAEKAANFKQAGFDGMMLDWWHNYAGNGRDAADVQVARLAIAKAIREKVGDDFLLMGNVNDNANDPTAQYLSGVFMELWKVYPELGYTVWERDEDWTTWNLSIERMEKLLMYWDTNLQPPRIIAFEPWKITTGDYIADRYTDENYQYAKLFTAMAVVIPENGYILYADNNGDWDGGDHQHAYYDFYHTDFGRATSGMVRVLEGVAYKKFEGGVIAYNRTESDVVVRLPGGKRFTIGPLEGLFLADQ